MTNEDRGLLLAIAAGDDTARMAHRDWLEERGDPRAEFIKSQEELEGVENEAEAFILDQKANELLTLYRDQWLKVPCRKCQGDGLMYETGPRWQGWNAPMDSSVRRVPCQSCESTGDETRLTQVQLWADMECKTPGAYRYPATFRRGYVDRIDGASLGELFEQRCKVCDETLAEAGTRGGGCAVCEGGFGHGMMWKPTPLILSWVRNHPVSEVVPSDREPWHVEGVWAWTKLENDTAADELPEVLFALCSETYPTRKSALSALGRAVVQAARRYLQDTEGSR